MNVSDLDLRGCGFGFNKTTAPLVITTPKQKANGVVGKKGGGNAGHLKL